MCVSARMRKACNIAPITRGSHRTPENNTRSIRHTSVQRSMENRAAMLRVPAGRMGFRIDDRWFNLSFYAMPIASANCEHIVGPTWSDCVPRFVWLYEHHDERILFYHNYMNKYIWIYIYFEFGSLLCVYMVQSALCKLKYVDRFAAFTIFNGGMRFSKQSPNPIPTKHPYRHKQNQVTNFHSLCWNFHVRMKVISKIE